MLTDRRRVKLQYICRLWNSKYAAVTEELHSYVLPHKKFLNPLKRKKQVLEDSTPPPVLSISSIAKFHTNETVFLQVCESIYQKVRKYTYKTIIIVTSGE